MDVARSDAVTFSAAVTVMVLLLEPETGVTVIHVALLFTVQLAFEVILKVF